MQSRLHRLGLTRSLQDRLFAGGLGLLFGIPTGYALFLRFTRAHIEATDIWDRVIDWISLEAFSVIFLLGLFGVTWAVAAPRWLEEKFFASIVRFMQLLFVTSLLLIAMFAYAVFHGA